MNKKKILFLTHSLDHTRGSGRYASGLIEGVRALEQYEVRVLTTLASGSPIEEPILYANFWKLVCVLSRIRSALREADVVHAMDVYPYGFIATFASLGLHKKIVLATIGSSSVQPLYGSLAPLARYVLRHASVVTAHGAYVVRRIHERMPRLDIRIIPPGITYEYFVRSGEKATRPHHRPYILSVAKVKKRKGVEISLWAFAKIAPHFPEVDYINVGVFREPYASTITALVASLGITGRVFFKEHIPDEELIALYQYAEFFVLLPQNVGNDIEGFGLVYVEAAAFGLPVIGAKESGAEDAIGENGYVISPTDVNVVAEKMAALLNTPSLRAELSEKSITFAKGLDWKNSISQYSTLYELLLEHPV